MGLAAEAGALTSPNSIAVLQHVIENGLRRPAVERKAVLLLVGTERRARQHAGLAVDLVLVKSTPGERLLHALHRGRRQLHHIAPRLLERSRVRAPVRQMPD